MIDDNLLLAQTSVDPAMIIKKDIFKYVKYMSDGGGYVGFFNKNICAKLCNYTYCDIYNGKIPRMISTSEIKNFTSKNKKKFGVVANSQSGGDGRINYLFVSDRPVLITGAHSQESVFNLIQN